MVQYRRNQLLIFLPTYNERDNVPEMVNRIQTQTIPADILFIDDNSPDGTGALLEDLARHKKGIFVVHRPRKQGIGSAHLDALGFAYQKGYSRLITMDADLTHAPEDIPLFLAAATENDVVLGSRFLPKATDERNGRERLLSRLSHWATSRFLRLPYDVTNAYRLYCLDRIDSKLFAGLQASGYAFFFESIFVLHKNSHRIKEVALQLAGRGAGQSKKKLSDIFRGGKQLLCLWRKHLFYRSY